MPRNELKFNISGVNGARKELNDIADDIHGGEVQEAMQQGAFMVQKSAKRNAPVDTGRLRASIDVTIEWEDQNLRGVMGSNVEYAPYMEMGTEPHFPPISALEGWARRHNINAYLVALSIAKTGLEARHFFRDALDQHRDEIIKLFNEAVSKAVRK